MRIGMRRRVRVKGEKVRRSGVRSPKTNNLVSQLKDAYSEKKQEGPLNCLKAKTATGDKLPKEERSTESVKPRGEILEEGECCHEKSHWGKKNQVQLTSNEV